MQKLKNYIIERLALAVLIPVLIAAGIIIYLQKAKVTELSNRPAVVEKVVVVTPTLAATPSATLGPVKALPKVLPSKAVNYQGGVTPASKSAVK